jgi:hypothetical protein
MKCMYPPHMSHMRCMYPPPHMSAYSQYTKALTFENVWQVRSVGLF